MNNTHKSHDISSNSWVSPSKRPWLSFATITVALAGFTFVLHASYPGYLHPDSVHQLEQALTWAIDDWHSPFVTLVWSMLLKAMPGPVGFIVLNNVLIWGASATLAIAMQRRFGAWSLLLSVVPFFPGLFNFLGYVHVDTILSAWLMAAVSTAYLTKSNRFSTRARRVLQLLANLFIVAAFLTRVNAIFCLLPILLYTNMRQSLRRNLAICALVLVVMPFLYKAQNQALSVKALSPSDSIKVYNLLALSYYEHENLIPGKWSEQQSQDIVNSCYWPVQWNTVWECGSIRGFIFDELKRQNIWGSSKLTWAWIHEVLHHPLGYFSILVPSFKKSMFDPNSRNMFFKTPNPWNWRVADDPPRITTAIAEGYIRSNFNDQLGRPWVYALLASIGIVLLFRMHIESSEEGRFALTVLTSGLIYLLTYFVINQASEYRYFYWCGFATYLGLLVVVVTAATMRWHPLSARPIDRTSTAILASVLVITALTLALVTFPFKLPTILRVITVTPSDGRPVFINGTHNASTPDWMRGHRKFESEIHSMSWIHEENGYRSGTQISPLVIAQEMLYESMEIVLATGPGMGVAAIDGEGYHREVNTAAAEPGSLSVLIPPPTYPKLGLFSLKSFGIASLYFLAFLILLIKLSHVMERWRKI